MSYFEARYLNTSVGKFNSLDPVFLNPDPTWLADPQAQNAYAYARNNPLRYNDPDGKNPLLIIWAVAEAVLSVVDVVHSAYVSLNPNIPQAEKQAVAEAAFVGMSLPGGGYTFSARKAAQTNIVENSYEVLSEQIVKGTSRSAHRNNENKALFNELKSNPQISKELNQSLNTDVQSHMLSGKSGLKNPPNTQWHHPENNQNTIQLLYTSDHQSKGLQNILHPGGNGGYSKYFKN